MALSQTDISRYQAAGYHVARGLFSKDEVAQFLSHYTAMRLAQNNGADTENLSSTDPLAIWPRLMQPHRHDRLSMDWLLDPRLNHYLTGLMGLEPYAVQTMVYFKPPGARGQALHQDQYYLRVQPGTCMAAWLALDDCDDENGCMSVVDGSHTWPVLCTIGADTKVSFTDVTVPLPPGAQATPLHLKAGDVLFFNGQVVHGSGPNTSDTRFRRALIGHYIAGDAEKVHKWYAPIYTMDGAEVNLELTNTGGRCGTWVDRDGAVVVELEPEIAASGITGPH
jgi:phytanoyl-CoA hydroxylase